MLLVEPETGKKCANRTAERVNGRSIPELCNLSIDAINTLPPEEGVLKRKMAARGRYCFNISGPYFQRVDQVRRGAFLSGYYGVKDGSLLYHP